MDLSTSYLGLALKNPIVPSASPLSRDLDTLRRLEDAGAAAVVMASLFEEQITLESLELNHYLDYFTESYAESLTTYPEPESFHMGPDAYLDHIRLAKAALGIPVIGSLNGFTTGGWISYAKGIEEAGADALELNVYYLPTNPLRNGAAVEEITLNIVRAVRQSVSIPVAVKLSPYYSSLANLATQLVGAGVNGLVLFNRFYQPDLDIDELEVVPSLKLSTPEELRLPLRWTAILYGRLQADLAITTGVHSGHDVLKSMMAGAQVAMVASELLQNGPERLAGILEEMRAWMEAHEYESVAQMRGSMSQRKVADPGVFERANYMRVLQEWRPDPAGGLYRQIVH